MTSIDSIAPSWHHPFGTFMVKAMDGKELEKGLGYRCAPEEVFKDEFLTAVRRATNAQTLPGR